jgi:predicted RNA polymerase sigma factor
VTCLAAVYRDYPGVRALILRRVRDPDLAADILQDAAVITREKLRNGSSPEHSSSPTSPFTLPNTRRSAMATC